MFPLTRVPFWYRFFEPQPNYVQLLPRRGIGDRMGIFVPSFFFFLTFSTGGFEFPGCYKCSEFRSALPGIEQLKGCGCGLSGQAKQTLFKVTNHGELYYMTSCSWDVLLMRHGARPQGQSITHASTGFVLPPQENAFAHYTLVCPSARTEPGLRHVANMLTG